jgi:hypothetical protein
MRGWPSCLALSKRGNAANGNSEEIKGTSCHDLLLEPICVSKINPYGGMYLTAPGTICSILGIWKSIHERFGSLRPSFPPRVHAESISSDCDGPAALSVHGAETLEDGWQRVDESSAGDAGWGRP